MTDELAALRAENARLIALLEAQGIEWRLPQPITWVAREQESSRLSTAEKVALFRRLFRGEPMFIRFAGKAKPRVRQVTPRPVPTSGAPVSARSRASSVATAATAC